MIRRLTLLALVASLIRLPTVHADKVTRKAERELAELRFDKAGDLATEALSEGKRGPEELVTLYMILGRVSASLGQDVKAQAYFQSALSIDSNASLPQGVSPKLSEPFATAKDDLQDAKPIELLAERDDANQLSVQVSSDPAQLVGGIEARFEVDGKPKKLRGDGRDIIRLDLPEGARNVAVLALDQYGNRLTEALDVQGSDAEGSTHEASLTLDDVSTQPKPAIYMRWQLYTGLAVVTLATGAILGDAARRKTDEIEQLPNGTEFAVALELEDQAESRALYANISFAATGILGVTAIVMYLSQDSGDEGQRKAATLHPAIGKDHVGVSASLSF